MSLLVHATPVRGRWGGLGRCLQANGVERVPFQALLLSSWLRLMVFAIPMISLIASADVLMTRCFIHHSKEGLGLKSPFQLVTHQGIKIFFECGIY